eukprot:gene12627-13917_t
MAARENAAAESTKNIGSASEGTNKISQYQQSELEENNNYSEKQDDVENTEDGEDSQGYSSPNKAAESDHTKVTSKYHKGPHGTLKRKGRHGYPSCRNRKATMPVKSRKNKKRRRVPSSASSSASSGESSASSSSYNSDSSSTDLSSSEEENNTWQMTKSEDLNAWKLPKKLAKTFAKHLSEHVTDEDIKTNILEENTVAKKHSSNTTIR